MSSVKRFEAHYLTEGVMGGKALACAEMVLASDYDRDTQALKERLSDRALDQMRQLEELIECQTERDALRAQVEAMLAAPANERATAFEACPESNCDWGAFYRGWMARAAMQAEQ